MPTHRTGTPGFSDLPTALHVRYALELNSSRISSSWYQSCLACNPSTCFPLLLVTLDFDKQIITEGNSTFSSPSLQFRNILIG